MLRLRRRSRTGRSPRPRSAAIVVAPTFRSAVPSFPIRNVRGMESPITTAPQSWLAGAAVMSGAGGGRALPARARSNGFSSGSSLVIRRAAVFAPGDAGVNVTSTWCESPGAIANAPPPAPTPNSAASAPARPVAVTFRPAFPTFRIQNVREEELPTVRPPQSWLPGVAAMSGAGAGRALPASARSNGLSSGSSLAIRRVAVFAPGAAGVNVTSTWWESPGAIVKAPPPAPTPNSPESVPVSVVEATWRSAYPSFRSRKER